MEQQTIKVIGCDIGGVVRNLQEDKPFPDSIEILEELSKNYKIIFISKCKQNFKKSSENFLKTNGLDKYPVFYCQEYYEKIEIAKKKNVSIMIDDLMKVLSTFPTTIMKIWVCDDQKKIDGANKFQKEFYDSVKLARNWKEIKKLLLN